jgi:hypothetical protein
MEQFCYKGGESVKWTEKSGSNSQSQKVCRVFIGLLLIVALLAVGPSGHIRDARGQTVSTFPMVQPGFVLNTGNAVFVVGNPPGSSLWPGTRWSDPVVQDTIAITVDGLSGNQRNSINYGQLTMLSSPFKVGQQYTVHVTGVYEYRNSSWDDTMTTGISFRFTMPPADGNYHAVDGAVLPLSVVVAGEAHPYVGVSHTYTATVSNGTSPYTYEFFVKEGSVFKYDSQPQSGNSFSYAFPAADLFAVNVLVTDSSGATSTGTLAVTSYIDQLAVVVSGDASAAPGSTHTYTGTFQGGVPPFNTKWTITGADSGISPVGSTSDRSESFPWKFGASIGIVHFRCDVTDSFGNTAYGTLDVNVGSYAPSFMAQLYIISGQTRFVMYPSVADTPGAAVDPGTMNQVTNTKDYTVDFNVSGLTWAYYLDGDVLPLANPLVVHVSYIDPASGTQYAYTFTFDTTNIAADGSWTKSNGTNGAGALPSWLQALRGMFIDGMKFLFVPTDQQMKDLLPSGSIGANLLDGTSWGSGDTSWKMTVHWKDTKGVPVDVVLVDVNFTKLGGFGTAVRYIVQAGMSLSLIYLVVVLI